MISRKRNRIRKTLPSYVICKYCEGKVIEEMEDTYIEFFFLELNKKREYFLICEACSRYLYQYELKKLPREEYKERKYTDGSIKKEYIERSDHGMIKETVYETKNKLPQTGDPELLSMTIIGVMALMSKYDTSINIRNSQNYSYIKESYKEQELSMNTIENLILEKSEEEAKLAVVALFKKCIKKFNKSELNFMMSQSLGLTKDQLVLNYKVNDFIRMLLLEMGYGELELESNIFNFRTKWMG